MRTITLALPHITISNGELLQEAELLRGRTSGSKEDEERLNRIENQIHFIRNKCSITGES
ncbi:MAG: hypothetical protein K0R28_6864 [Paenibacillus sp.]|nr:hypothetical protein [Paenibacillus sp.]